MTHPQALSSELAKAVEGNLAALIQTDFSFPLTQELCYSPFSRLFLASAQINVSTDIHCSTAGKAKDSPVSLSGEMV